jgi:HSP20 family protein
MTQLNAQELNPRDKKPLDVGSAESTSTTPQFIPPVDIWDNEKGLTVVADIPGVALEGLNLDLNDNALTILGRVVSPREGLRILTQEFAIGDYYRQFKLNGDIDKENIVATVKDGVLTVSLPKLAPAQPRKIAVAAG